MPLDKKTAVNAVNGITRWSLLEGLMINGIAMMASSAILLLNVIDALVDPLLCFTDAILTLHIAPNRIALLLHRSVIGAIEGSCH